MPRYIRKPIIPPLKPNVFGRSTRSIEDEWDRDVPLVEVPMVGDFELTPTGVLSVDGEMIYTAPDPIGFHHEFVEAVRDNEDA